MKFFAVSILMWELANFSFLMYVYFNYAIALPISAFIALGRPTKKLVAQKVNYDLMDLENFCFNVWVLINIFFLFPCSLLTFNRLRFLLVKF